MKKHVEEKRDQDQNNCLDQKTQPHRKAAGNFLVPEYKQVRHRIACKKNENFSQQQCFYFSVLEEKVIRHCFEDVMLQ